MSRKRSRNPHKKLVKAVTRTIDGDPLVFGSSDEAYAAIEATLERLCEPGIPFEWAERSFLRWLGPRIVAPPEKTIGAFSSPRRTLPDEGTVNFFIAFVQHLRAQRSRANVGDDGSASDTCKRRLLETVLSAGDERTSASIEAMLAAVYEKEPGDAAGVGGYSQAQLRLRFFTALHDGRDKKAFLALGALAESEHDPGELTYLQGLALSKSSQVEEVREAVQLLSRLRPGDKDFARGQSLLLELHAQLGQVAEIWSRLAELQTLEPAVQFSKEFILYLGSLAILNSSSPTDDLRRYVEAMVAFASGTPEEIPIREDNASMSLLTRHAVSIAAEARAVLQEEQLQKGILGGASAGDLTEGGGPPLRSEQLACALGLFAPAVDIVNAVDARAASEVAESMLVSGRLFTPDVIDHLLAMRLRHQMDDRDGFLNVVVANLERLVAWDLPEAWDVIALAYQEAIVTGSDAAPRLRTQILMRGGKAKNLLESLEQEAGTEELVRGLTEMGRRSYLAANWMLQTAQGMGLGWHDAGMISLGFFRILELEINQRLVVPILRGERSSDNQLQLEHLIENLRERSGPLGEQSKTKRDALTTWEMLLAAVEDLRLGKIVGIELGALERLLGRARHVKGSDKELRAFWRDQLISKLMPAGVVALDDGSLCDLISNEARNRYRNPPAHTRFLPLRVATECKEHVDRSLRSLRKWIVT